jgi:hypothetical protein
MSNIPHCDRITCTTATVHRVWSLQYLSAVPFSSVVLLAITILCCSMVTACTLACTAFPAQPSIRSDDESFQIFLFSSRNQPGLGNGGTPFRISSRNRLTNSAPSLQSYSNWTPCGGGPDIPPLTLLQLCPLSTIHFCTLQFASIFVNSIPFFSIS